MKFDHQPPPVLKRKAFAYITHRGRLLVFSHPLVPDAGIQVPAGTIESGELPEDGVLREAWEETGLDNLVLDSFLGERRRDMRDFGCNEVHQRFFFHLVCASEPPETWRNYEPDPANGGELPLFEFFWASLPDELPYLIADHGAVLPELLRRLALPEAADRA